MKKAKKWIANVLFLAAIVGLTLYGLLHNSDLGELAYYLDLANGWYWLAAFGLVVAFILCEAWILWLLLRGQRCDPRAGHCMVYAFTGFFFSCITPSAGGGQPAVVYYMHRDGIGVSVATPVLVVETISYKLVLVIYGIILLLVRPVGVMIAPAIVRWWALLGWVLNVAFIAGCCLVLLKPGLVLRLGGGVLSLLGRFFKAERIARWRERFENFVGRYAEASLTIRHDGGRLSRVALLSFFQRSLLFAVTWVVLRSFSITALSLPAAVMMQAMVSLGTDLLPLPGGTGANETMFMLLFTAACGETMVLPVLLVSRAISYYGQLVLSGLVTLFASRVTRKRETT